MKRKKKCVWMAVSEEPPYLPIAVADTAEELAQIVGVHPGTVIQQNSKWENGKVQNKNAFRKYYKFDIEENEDA